MTSRIPLMLALAASALLAACGRQVAVPAPDAPAQICDSVTLPATVSGAGLRPTQEQGTAAWGEPPITYRCGVSRPAALAPTSQLLDVLGVGWLPVEGVGGTGFIAVTWPTQSEPVYIEVLVPEECAAPADVLIDISAALGAPEQ